MKAKDIEELFKHASWDELEKLIREYEDDERANIQKLAIRYRRKLELYHNELDRLKLMNSYENEYAASEYVCGIDEAGRGPYAGPVVAAAVVLPKNCRILYLNDSKKLSEKRREELYDEIMEKAVSVGVGLAGPDIIDDINILQADYQAMREAVSKLSVKPDVLLNDAVIIPDLDIPQRSIIHGDAKSISIAAASVIAKVTRDRLMQMYDKLYPEYGFADNKGYGTKAHEAAIREHGLCAIHRRSFTHKFFED